MEAWKILEFWKKRFLKNEKNGNRLNFGKKLIFEKWKTGTFWSVWYQMVPYGTMWYNMVHYGTVCTTW